MIKNNVWQSKNIVNGSMFFVFKIRLYIQVMHKILYIKPYLEGIHIVLKHPIDCTHAGRT